MNDDDKENDSIEENDNFEKNGIIEKNDNIKKMALSKHLKGQLGPPVSDEKCLFVTKNDHFLKVCHEGQMEPPVSDEKCLFSCYS